MSQGCERDRPNPMWSNQWTNGKVGDFNNTLVLPGSARAASWFTLREYTYKNHKAGFQFLETFYPAIQQEIREVSPWGVLKLSYQYIFSFFYFFSCGGATSSAGRRDRFLDLLSCQPVGLLIFRLGYHTVQSGGRMPPVGLRCQLY